MGHLSGASREHTICAASGASHKQHASSSFQSILSLSHPTAVCRRCDPLVLQAIGFRVWRDWFHSLFIGSTAFANSKLE